MESKCERRSIYDYIESLWVVEMGYEEIFESLSSCDLWIKNILNL